MNWKEYPIRIFVFITLGWVAGLASSFVHISPSCILSRQVVWGIGEVYIPAVANRCSEDGDFSSTTKQTSCCVSAERQQTHRNKKKQKNLASLMINVKAISKQFFHSHYIQVLIYVFVTYMHKYLLKHLQDVVFGFRRHLLCVCSFMCVLANVGCCVFYL